LIVEDESLSLAMLRAIIGGFHRPDQEHLVEPYAPRYFEALEPLWEKRGDEIALAFARAMYPYPLMGEKLVAMTDQALSKSLPGPLRRLLLEGKDDVVRAIKARAKDSSP
jgi:aminopeptidase N